MGFRDHAEVPVSNPLFGLMADLIARIEAGAPPWRQPWQGGAEPGLPLRANGEPFTGSNAWTLAFIGAMKISRRSVGRFLAEAVREPRFVGRTVALSGGRPTA